MISLFMLLPLLCMAQREKFTQEHFTPSTDVVEVLDNQISLDIKVVVPPNFFGRNTIAKLTPVFRWERKEVCGKSVFFQGEMVDESYRIVGFKLGVTDELSLKFDYSLGMEGGGQIQVGERGRHACVTPNDHVRLEAQHRMDV